MEERFKTGRQIVSIELPHTEEDRTEHETGHRLHKGFDREAG